VRNTAKNVFLHTVDEADFAISAKLDFKPDQNFQSAGLIIYRDENANFAATRRYHSYFENKSLCIQGVDTDSFTEGHMADPSQEQAPIWLRVVKEGTTVTSYYRFSEEDEWTEYDSREWSSFEGAEAGDLKVGFYTGNSKSNGSPAVFSDFSIQYGSEAPQETAIFEETEIEAPDERIEYITDRDWYSAEVGYGSPKKDTGVDGDAIVLGGRTYKWDGDSEWTQICQQTYTGLTGDQKVGLYVANAGNEDIQIPASFSDFTVQYAGEEPVQITFSEKNPNAEPEEPEELSTAVLEYALELAGKVSTENVMDAVAERFEAVKAEAQAVLDAAKAGDLSVTQKQIDDSWKALIDIMQHLSFEKVDKAALESVIKFAEEIEPNLNAYMETGKQEFTDALADARTVYEDELAMADEVEQAWTRLLKAAADLRLYADKDALEDLISEAEAIDLTAYTEESARAFTEALVSAKEVLADETLSEDDQSIVDEAAEALEAARGQLVAKADAEDPSGTTADPGQSSGEDGQNTADGQKTADKTAGTGSGSQTAVSGSKAVKTGDTASMAGYLLAAGAALAAAGTEVVRRKRTR